MVGGSFLVRVLRWRRASVACRVRAGDNLARHGCLVWEGPDDVGESARAL